MESVLVVIGYTDMKYWCRPLVPGIFDKLTYKNKHLLFIDDKNYPGLSDKPSGEMVAASIRQEGINYARKREFDWIFFCDVDTIPDVDIIEKLRRHDRPLVGAVHAARGNANLIIGHNLMPENSLNRFPLAFQPEDKLWPVSCVSGGLLLVHRSLFDKADYRGYNGPDTIPGRFTADDEWFEMDVKKKTGVTPWLDLGTGGWHLNDDGKAYRWPGLVKPYRRVENIIFFNQSSYVQK